MLRCSGCRHLVFQRRLLPIAPHLLRSQSSWVQQASPDHQAALNDLRAQLGVSGAHRKTKRRDEQGGSNGKGKEKELGFFERSFRAEGRTGVLGFGGGHVGSSADELEAVPQPSGSRGPPAEASTSTTPTTPQSQSAEATPTAAPLWRPVPEFTFRRRVALYKALSKFRLSSLVILTAMGGYTMVPPDAVTLAADTFASVSPGLLPSSTTFSLPTLLSTAAGTLLCAASTNTVNQIVEAPYDAQMARTRGRPLVRRIVTPFHAAAFAGLTGTAGVGILACFVNPLTAGLGLANVLLYALVYTPLKRVSIVNTWVGAVVGAIPPLMGWSAVVNSIDPVTQPGAWILFFVVFAWQFPHFNSFAHTHRRDYAKAGYRMMSVTDPKLNARVALRYALLFFPLCSYVIPAVGLTSWSFAAWSLAPNLLMAAPAWEFWKARTDKAAKRLFWASLVHMPLLLVLMMVTKKREQKEDEVVEGETARPAVTGV